MPLIDIVEYTPNPILLTKAPTLEGQGEPDFAVGSFFSGFPVSFPLRGLYRAQTAIGILELFRPQP